MNKLAPSTVGISWDPPRNVDYSATTEQTDVPARSRAKWLGPDKPGFHFGQFSFAIQDDERLEGKELLVYMALIRFADTKTGECFPSMVKLKSPSKLKSRSTINDAVDKLVETGWIEKSSKRTPDGKVNRYTLLPPPVREQACPINEQTHPVETVESEGGLSKKWTRGRAIFGHELEPLELEPKDQSGESVETDSPPDADVGMIDSNLNVSSDAEVVSIDNRSVPTSGGKEDQILKSFANLSVDQRKREFSGTLLDEHGNPVRNEMRYRRSAEKQELANADRRAQVVALLLDEPDISVSAAAETLFEGFDAVKRARGVEIALRRAEAIEADEKREPLKTAPTQLDDQTEPWSFPRSHIEAARLLVRPA